MKCQSCYKTLVGIDTVVAIQGALLCKNCATNQYSEYMLETFGEELLTEDIDDTVCDWCHEPNCELIKTNLGMICDKCSAAIRSRGEKVQEER